MEATKAVVITRTLAVRRRWSDAFGPGATYEPLELRGPAADRVVGYVRGAGDRPRVAVVVTMRAPAGSDWAGTTVALPPGRWSDALCDGARAVTGDVEVAEWFDRFPVAVLEEVDGEHS